MRKVLIVEDEAISAIFLKNFFKKNNFEIIDAVKSGQEAINKTKETKPDLIVMDIQLIGDMNGIEAMKIINNNTNHIYCSAYSEPDIINNASSTHPLAYFVKPVNIDKLKSFIDTNFV